VTFVQEPADVELHGRVWLAYFDAAVTCDRLEMRWS
jgi:hypothetical protein